MPEINIDGGKAFQHENCWEDICHAILEAHHMVYIVGWSIYHKVKLVREPTRPLPNGGDLNLGELLKYKSQEGVRVLLLVWDDKTSHSKFFINTVVGTLYTHHQKCVIVDTQAQGNNRKITAFIGGLDLCDGRYDTPQHRLFSDRHTVFQGDYHNPTFPIERISWISSPSSSVPNDDPSLWVSNEDDPENWHAQVHKKSHPLFIPL
nr:phospholipase D delta-like [Ipomoea batatas]